MKTYYQVKNQDLLKFTDLCVYVRGIGKNSLNDLVRSSMFPPPVFGRFWRKSDIDQFLQGNIHHDSPIGERLERMVS